MQPLDDNSIKKAVEELDSNEEKRRNPAFNFLLPVSKEQPELLSRHWDILVKILLKEQVSNPFVAIPLIANLTIVDKENKFEDIFDLFYKLIDHESPVVSPHIAGNSGTIINAKPHLENQILDILLTTDEHSQCRHKGLLKAYVIIALEACYANLTNKDRVIDYVKSQQYCDSPKTRKLAKVFLKSHSSNS